MIPSFTSGFSAIHTVIFNGLKLSQATVLLAHSDMIITEPALFLFS